MSNDLQNFSTIKIILFNDDKDAVKFIEDIVEYHSSTVKFNVLKVGSIKHAIHAISAGIPDAILTSLTSKRNEILNVIKRLREANSEVPIIAIGASGCEDLALEAVKLGAQDCLFIETLDKSRVVPTIQYAIERRRISSHLMNLHTNQISATINSVSDGILIASAEKNIIFANKSAEQLLWKSSSELIGKKVPLPFIPGQKLEYTLVNPSGEQIFVEINTTIVPWEDGNAGFCVTIHDISDHTKIQSQLKSSAKLKDEFIAHMSHELRTPMNGIIGVTSLLLEQALSEDILNYVKTIRKSGETMLAIINDLLDLSKIEAGKLELEHSEFDIYSLIMETMDLFSQKAKEKGLFFTCHFSENVPQKVVADDSRIRQVLTNFLSNAIKYTDKGYIKVILSAEEHHLKISVADTGIGIAHKHQKHLFEPFTQLSSDPKRKQGGTGLGLTISKKLTELMGGEIFFKSTLHKGSEFTFSVKYLPSSHARTDMTKELTNKKIYIVSKNKYLVESCKEELPSTNIIIEKIEAKDFKNIDADLLLLDREILPNKQYLENYLIKFRKKNKIPIIIIGRAGIDQDFQNRHSVTIMSRYPFKPVEYRRLVADVLNSANQINYVKSEPSAIRKKISVFKEQNWKILVAEDNTINQHVLLSMLEHLGVNADAVCNGLEAVEKAKNYQYNAILMDCRMPVMDGYDAAKEIRLLSQHYSSIPIIAVTANALKSERIKCDESLMDYHLSKPITLDSLKEVLEKFLNGEKSPLLNSVKNLAGSKGSNFDQESYCQQNGFNYSVLKSLENVSNKIGKNILLEVMQLFFNLSPDIISDIKTAAVNKSADDVASLAHKLKGSARNIGAHKMALACEKLEMINDQLEFSNTFAIINEIEREFKFAVQFLKSLYPINSMTINENEAQNSEQKISSLT